MSLDQLFVSCIRGLEPLLIEELREMGLTDLREGFCGVHVIQGDLATIFKINYCSRLASRVLLPLLQFNCHDEKSLYQHVQQVDWSHYIRQGDTIAVDANVYHPQLRHSL